MRHVSLTLAAISLIVAAADACSLCDAGGLANRSPTFREEARLAMARAIVHGTISNPRASGVTGETDFHIQTTLRGDPALKGKKSLVLPLYLPINDKDKPPQYLLFIDVDKNKVDPYRGIVVKNASTVEYVKKALALDPKDRAANLIFFFNYLEDADPEVAKDAFSEFAAAADADIATAAPKLNPVKLRRWLTDMKTPPARLGVYALLLALVANRPTSTCSASYSTARRSATLLPSMVFWPATCRRSRRKDGASSGSRWPTAASRNCGG